jgi:hypothetical protein
LSFELVSLSQVCSLLCSFELCGPLRFGTRSEVRGDVTKLKEEPFETEWAPCKLGGSMKTKITFLILAAFALNASADAFPKVVPVAVNTGYIPVGFDTNDNSQLVAEGLFANTCYKAINPKVKVDHDQKTIRVYPRALKYKGICLQMVVPFHKEIDVGLLRAGTYKVLSVMEKEEKQIGDMQVAIATNESPDDFLYAPVSQAYFGKENDKYYVTISGMFPQTCYQMREVVVRVQSNVLVIQPIAEKTDEVCEERLKPYSETVEVKNVTPGRYLLHVRSLNGKAVNNLVDVL